MWADSPGLMVAELATASTAQPPGLTGSSRISLISSTRLPVLVKAKRYSGFSLTLMRPKSCERS